MLDSDFRSDVEPKRCSKKRPLKEAARAAEQASYLALSQIGYNSGTTLPGLISYFLDESKS
jgi:hypothetical protein